MSHHHAQLELSPHWRWRSGVRLVSTTTRLPTTLECIRRVARFDRGRYRSARGVATA